MPSKLNDTSPSNASKVASTDKEQHQQQQQQQQQQHHQHDAKSVDAKPSATKPTKLKDLSKDQLFAFVQSLKTGTKNDQGTTSEDGVKEMYNEYEDNAPENNEDEDYKYFEEWREYQRMRQQQGAGTHSPPPLWHLLIFHPTSVSRRLRHQWYILLPPPPSHI